MFFLIDAIDYWLHPNYVVMRGFKIDDRMIMFIGAHPVFKKDEYGNKVVTFTNNRHQCFANNIHKRIWTFRELIKWRRLIGKTTRCLRSNIFKLERV